MCGFVIECVGSVSSVWVRYRVCGFGVECVGSVSSVCGRCSGVVMFRFCLYTKGDPESYSS